MIRGSGVGKDGKPYALLGLTDENWRRLRTGGDEGLGQPIKVELADLGLPPMTVIIIAGPDEPHMAATLAMFGLIAPGTDPN
jgi:hypothetical protein